jgi:AcrR family transcriptional regulator
VSDRRQQQKEATAQRIFEIAVELFRSRGYNETTVAAITEAAGVAKGTFFTHFASKDAVLGHLGRMQLARLMAALTANPEFGEHTFREQIRFIFRILGDGIADQRELVLITAIEILRSHDVLNTDLHGIAGFDRVLLPLVVAAQARGELRADASAPEVAGLVRGIYFQSVFEWLRRDDEPFFEVAARQLDLVLGGLQART